MKKINKQNDKKPMIDSYYDEDLERMPDFAAESQPEELDSENNVMAQSSEFDDTANTQAGTEEKAYMSEKSVSIDGVFDQLFGDVPDTEQTMQTYQGEIITENSLDDDVAEDDLDEGLEPPNDVQPIKESPEYNHAIPEVPEIELTQVRSLDGLQNEQDFLRDFLLRPIENRKEYRELMGKSIHRVYEDNKVNKKPQFQETIGEWDKVERASQRMEERINAVIDAADALKPAQIGLVEIEEKLVLAQKNVTSLTPQIELLQTKIDSIANSDSPEQQALEQSLHQELSDLLFRRDKAQELLDAFHKEQAFALEQYTSLAENLEHVEDAFIEAQEDLNIIFRLDKILEDDFEDFAEYAQEKLPEMEASIGLGYLIQAPDLLVMVNDHLTERIDSLRAFWHDMKSAMPKVQQITGALKKKGKPGTLDYSSEIIDALAFSHEHDLPAYEELQEVVESIDPDNPLGKEEALLSVMESIQKDIEHDMQSDQYLSAA